MRSTRPMMPMLLASLCVLALAVFGWGVTWSDMARMAAISILMVMLAAALAAIPVALLYLYRRFRSKK